MNSAKTVKAERGSFYHTLTNTLKSTCTNSPKVCIRVCRPKLVGTTYGIEHLQIINAVREETILVFFCLHVTHSVGFLRAFHFPLLSPAAIEWLDRPTLLLSLSPARTFAPRPSERKQVRKADFPPRRERKRDKKKQS